MSNPTSQVDDEEATQTIPTNVVMVACRNRRTHFLLPVKDTDFAGIICERVMVISGCNSILLPFPEPDCRVNALQTFRGNSYFWSISKSGGTGPIHCPVLKIEGMMESVGNMRFSLTGYQAALPFIRFHLGSEEAQWLINNPGGLDRRDCLHLRSFLDRLHGVPVKGRKIALLGQSILRNICVFQVGKIMFMMTPESVNQTFNPHKIATECFKATTSLVLDYENFHDLHDDGIDLYDKDGDMPPEEGEDGR